MTTMSPEQVVVDPTVDHDSLEDFEFEVVCDITRLQLEHPNRTPVCQGDPATWVAWRANCCPQSPRFRLICDRCKRVYQAWIARHASITCMTCGAETGGFVSFTPLGKKA